MKIIHKIKKFVVKVTNWIADFPHLIETKAIDLVHKIQTWMLKVIITGPQKGKAEKRAADMCVVVRSSQIKSTICNL